MCRRRGGRLIEAIRAGAFEDVEARPTFYTSHTVVGRHEAVDGGD